MTMIVAVHQPQYMPWLGYFDKMDRADAFVLLDTVQFKKNEWQNRNKIKTSDGWQWLTVPVRYRFPQKIFEVGIDTNVPWQRKHRQALRTHYTKAPYFNQTMEVLEPILSEPWEKIAPLNIKVVKELASALGITTQIHIASEMGKFPENPHERLVAITKHLGGDVYLAGSGSQAYVEIDYFKNAGIELIFQDYNHPQYPQLFGLFEYFMSVIDLMFNCGPDSLSIIRRK